MFVNHSKRHHGCKELLVNKYTAIILSEEMSLDFLKVTHSES